MPAVKANAYGHGAVLIAGALQDMGIDAFCVATAVEGAELRQAGIRGIILVLGYTDPDDFSLLEQYHLTQTVVSLVYARELNGYGKPLSVHIAIDTGMHRLGERWNDTDVLKAICRMENLQVNGAFTHLCTAASTDKAGQAFTRRQAQRFYTAVRRLRADNIVIPKVHLLGSYGILRCPKAPGDYARPGIALYGVLENAEDTANCPIPLQPVLSLKARIAVVHQLLPGEGAGYGLAFTAERKTVLATASIGYADGLTSQLGRGQGRALLHGHSAPIVGRICMDQCLLDVTDVPNVQTGDEAVFIGISGHKSISACELAATSGTITNELLSRLGLRLTRVLG